MLTIWRKFVIKPPSKILQKQVNGLWFGYKTGLQIRKINACQQKYILSEFKRVGLYKKIYSSANPLSKVYNGGFMNNEDPANTQNSTIYQ